MKHPARKSLGFQLVLAARLHRTRSAMLLGEIGLFPGQEQALQALGSTEQMSMGQLAHAMRVRPPTISKTIARLAAQGLVERDLAGADGRVVTVCLTQVGRDKLARIEDIGKIVEDEILEHLDSKDARRLNKLLRRVSKGLGGASEIESVDIDQPDDE